MKTRGELNKLKSIKYLYTNLPNKITHLIASNIHNIIDLDCPDGYIICNDTCIIIEHFEILTDLNEIADETGLMSSKAEDPNQKALETSIDDLDFLITPYNCLGGIPMLEACKRNLKIYAIKENKTVLNIEQYNLSLKCDIINTYKDLMELI